MKIRIILHESVVESNLVRIANEQNWWMHERYAADGGNNVSIQVFPSATLGVP